MNETAKRTMTGTAKRTVNKNATKTMNENTTKTTVNDNAHKKRMGMQIPNERMAFNGQLGPGPWPWAQGPEHREIHFWG